MSGFSFARGLKTLKARLNVSRRLREVARERDQLSRQLAALRHDRLTGLMNRVEFFNTLPARHKTGQSGALMMVDIDNFKRFNDAFGHTAGDALLQRFADRLSAWVPTEALVARIGGDEFVVFLPGVAAAESWIQCETLLKRLREPLEVNGASHVITASIGFADCGDLGSYEVVQRADTALYAAKSRGRDRAVAYGSAVETIPAARRQLASIVVDLQQQLIAVRGEARTDALTALPNRRALEEAMVTLQANDAVPLGVAFVDLDHFGVINHTQGDAAGDRVLRQVADALKSAIRQDDLVFRKGGEEFVVLMPGITGKAATQAATRMLHAIRMLCIANQGGSGGAHLTATIGVAGTEGEAPYWTVLERASDVAMEAKGAQARDAVHEWLER